MEKIAKPSVEKLDLADVDNKTARKMIAQDILNYLDARFMIANKNSYIIVPEANFEKFAQDPNCKDVPVRYPFTYDDREQIRDESAREYVEAFPACGVCAIGSLLIATILRFNVITLRDLGGVAIKHRKNAMQYLQKFFTPIELGMMEACFENGSYVEWMDYEEGRIVRNSSAWSEFFRKFNTPDERLRAIMQNILDNDGEFKLENKPETETT